MEVEELQQPQNQTETVGDHTGILNTLTTQEQPVSPTASLNKLTEHDLVGSNLSNLGDFASCDDNFQKVENSDEYIERFM